MLVFLYLIVPGVYTSLYDLKLFATMLLLYFKNFFDFLVTILLLYYPDIKFESATIAFVKVTFLKAGGDFEYCF